MINSDKLEGLLTFVGKYKYSGLDRVSNSSHEKSVHTVHMTVGHSALPVSIFINVENQEPFLLISMFS